MLVGLAISRQEATDLENDLPWCVGLGKFLILKDMNSIFDACSC